MTTETILLPMTSPSRSSDASHLAASDIAAICGRANVEYRLVGGASVTLLTWVHGVTDLVPERETADADLGTQQMVVGSPKLVSAILERGYQQVEGNRFTRSEPAAESALELTIDVLAPSYGSTLQANSQHGQLVVDLVPGLALALARNPTPVRVDVRLTSGARLTYEVPLPDPIAALCMKAYSYASRFAQRDAIDIWRLLETANAKGMTTADWPLGPTGKDTSVVLQRFFGRTSGSGLKAATGSTPSQTRIRALVRRIVPEPLNGQPSA